MKKVPNSHYSENYRSEVSILLGSDDASVGNWSQFKTTMSSGNTAGYATTNECYKEQLLLVKSGCYNEHRCYNERGGIPLADVALVGAGHVRPSRFDYSVSHHLCYHL
jgi:hypothetical protein